MLIKSDGGVIFFGNGKYFCTQFLKSRDHLKRPLDTNLWLNLTFWISKLFQHLAVIDSGIIVKDTKMTRTMVWNTLEMTNV